MVEVKGDTGLVYGIRSEKDKSGKVRVVHRNHLLPCSSLPLEFPTELQKPRKTRKTSKKKVVAQEVNMLVILTVMKMLKFGLLTNQLKMFLKILTVMMLVSVMMM